MIKGNCAQSVVAHFLKCVCFENFVPGFEEDRPKDSEK